jgi:hypothetical protein
MPLEDALSLVSKDFDHFVLSGRRAGGLRRLAPPPAAPDVPHLLGKAASGASLSSLELSAVISALQKQKQDDNIASSSHNGMKYTFAIFIKYVFPVYGKAPCRLIKLAVPLKFTLHSPFQMSTTVFFEREDKIESHLQKPLSIL